MARERILVADDEPYIAQLCSRALSQLGYEVRGVTSGREVLACLEAGNRSGARLDLLVVDIKMPEVDGLTVLRRARELDPSLNAVVITGYGTIENAIEALTAGARRFILKPFDVDELVTAVQETLAEREREQERLRLRAQLPILELGQALMTKGDVPELSRRLLEVVARQMGAERALIALRDEDGGLYVVAAIGWDDVKGQVGFGLRRDLLQKDLLQKDLLQKDLLQKDLLQGLLQVPLRTAQKEIGTLFVGGVSDADFDAEKSVSERPPTTPTSDALPGFPPSARTLLEIMARQIAIALENARMYAAEQQRSAELAQALEQRRELDRLKSEFIRNVSHELRTPTSLILGYAELLASGELGELQAEHRDPLAAIVHQALVLRDLVEDITALAENENREPKRGPVCLAEIVKAALADFQMLAARSGQRLTASIESGTPPALGDARHLGRILDNLIGNALKFTPRGGSVSVDLRHSDDWVVLEVRDTGIGIAAEHQARIFERFYQVDGTLQRRYEGSGLGLALVKEIVEAHGGTVTVESQPGQGSAFTVRLPADVQGEKA